MIAPPFFPRGKGPLVSILLPTRGRPDHLCETVDSLYSLAVDKSNLEFIFKVDDDDAPTIDRVEKISKGIPNCKSIISPRGRGYPDFHLWVNQMCSISSGDWLFLMNDDSKMTTQGWDYILWGLKSSRCWIGMNEICLLLFSEKKIANSIAFPLLRRQAYELMGHFSLSTLCDDWIFRVMYFCGCYLYAPFITMEHYSFQDDLKKGNLKSNDFAYDAIVTSEVMRLRAEDAIKISNRIDWFESRLVWSTDPGDFKGWMYWREESKGRLDDVLVESRDRVWVFNDSGEESRKVEDMGGFWAIKE